MSIFDDMKAQIVPDYVVNDDYLSESYGETVKDAYSVLEDDHRISLIEEERERMNFIGPIQILEKEPTESFNFNNALDELNTKIPF